MILQSASGANYFWHKKRKTLENFYFSKRALGLVGQL